MIYLKSLSVLLSRPRARSPVLFNMARDKAMNTTSGNVNLFGRTFTWLDVQLSFYSRNFVIFHFSTVNGEGNSTFPLQYPPRGGGATS